MKCTAPVLALTLMLPFAAHAGKFVCVTSPEISNVAFVYDNRPDSKRASTGHIERFEIADKSAQAGTLLQALLPDSGPMPEAFVRTDKLDPAEKHHQVETETDGQIKLSVPYLRPSSVTVTRLSGGPLIFDGKTVKEVVYIYCGKE